MHLLHNDDDDDDNDDDKQNVCMRTYLLASCLYAHTICILIKSIISHLQAFEISNSMALNSLIMVDKNYLDNK